MLRATVVLIALVAAVGTAFAGTTTKLGAAVLLFNEPTVTVEAKAAQPVSELQLKVSGETARVTKLVVRFADGSAQTISSYHYLRPGVLSDAIALDRTAAVGSLEVTYDGDPGAGRARLLVYGS